MASRYTVVRLDWFEWLLKFDVCWKIYESKQDKVLLSSSFCYEHCDDGKGIPGGTTFVFDLESIKIKWGNNGL